MVLLSDWERKIHTREMKGEDQKTLKRVAVKLGLPFSNKSKRATTLQICFWAECYAQGFYETRSFYPDLDTSLKRHAEGLLARYMEHELISCTPNLDKFCTDLLASRIRLHRAHGITLESTHPLHPDYKPQYVVEERAKISRSARGVRV